MDTKYKTDKLYWFILNNEIYSGYITGWSTAQSYDGKGNVTSEKSDINVKCQKTGLTYILRWTTLFESIEDLLKSFNIQLNTPSENMRTFKWYEDIAMDKKYKNYGVGETVVYPSLKLNGEAGEVAEKVGKVLRDKLGIFTKEDNIEIAKELSDCLWYINATANDLGFSLQEIAQLNVEKICSRRERNVISGNGDNR